MLYNFLTSTDLDGSIKEEQLDQLVRGNLTLVVLAEASAVSWMHDYLGQRYDLAGAFPRIGEWAAGNEYGPARPVVVPATPAFGPEAPRYGLEFYERPIDYPAGRTYTPRYDYNDAGRLTNYVWHEGTYYEALMTSLGVEPGAADPLAALAWRERDPRDPKLVSFAVDIALFYLFKRVAPRKIPDFRISLYNQAKE